MLGLYNESGELAYKYLYDPWGKLVWVHDKRDRDVTDEESAALRNPFRYRGYYYDSDTGWYYLNSRYYDPETGRFLNVDGYASTGQGIIGHNMFVYCNNNPVMNVDFNGTWVLSISDTSSIVCGLGVSSSKALVIDGHGNIGIQPSYGGYDTGYAGSLAIGGGLSIAYIWDADNIYELEGVSTYTGASGGPWWYIGADMIDFNNSDKANGFSIVLGAGLGVDIHVAETKTVGTVTIKHEKIYTFYGGSIYGVGGGTWKWAKSKANRKGEFFTDDFGNSMYRFNGRLFWVDGTDMYEVFE